MTTQYLEVEHGKLAYDSTGDGPLVIAVPGMGDMRAQYRFLAPQLAAAGYRVVRLDPRGQGESGLGWTDVSVAGIGQDMLDLIRALDAGPAVLVGNSMAAGAAIWAAVEAPEQVRALVLLDPAVRGDVSGALHVLLAALFARPWGPAMWLAYFKRLFVTRKPDDFAAYSAALKRNLREPGRIETLYRMMIASKQASEARAKQVRAPALVLMGSKDPDFKDPAAEAAWVAGQMNAPFEMIAGAGHYPHVEMPEITGPKIIAFLNTLAPEVDHAANIHDPARA